MKTLNSQNPLVMSEFINSNDEGNYSTKAEKIGTWIDGSSIYQQTFIIKKADIKTGSQRYPLPFNYKMIVDASATMKVENYGNIMDGKAFWYVFGKNILVSGSQGLINGIGDEAIQLSIVTALANTVVSDLYITIKYVK